MHDPPINAPPPPCTQVLLATRLKRTDSLNQPDLFRFAEHFEFLSLLGLTPYSEVWGLGDEVGCEIKGVWFVPVYVVFGVCVFAHHHHNHAFHHHHHHHHHHSYTHQHHRCTKSDTGKPRNCMQ